MAIHEFSLSGMDEEEVFSHVFPISRRIVNCEVNFSAITNVRIFVYIGNNTSNLAEANNIGPYTDMVRPHLIEQETGALHCQFSIRPESGATGPYSATCKAVT